MTDILFARRKGLGAGSIRGLQQYLTTATVTSAVMNTSCLSRTPLVQTDTSCTTSEPTSECRLVVRWGTTATLGVPLSQQVNKSSAIHLVNNKRMMRVLLGDLCPDIVPTTTTQFSGQITYPLVLRPSKHAQGRKLWLVNDMQELVNLVRTKPRTFRDGWYASEYINKVAEYRVYVVQGRVATVANKTPADPSAVAWNVAQGGRFDVVPWGDWPMEAVRVAIQAFNHSGLDFSGVDVMIDEQGKAYVIELNSAPSLPGLSDGSVSYRQKCMGKTFRWMVEHGLAHMEVDHYDNWRGVIHPAIQGYD